ncbi:MAG: chloride channel protein [Propionicimonas sp.]|uniref:chloride channel protein n=1 Tax=Propionicimonas sp. TaxID=1955623 RepID=UPI003D1246A7
MAGQDPHPARAGAIVRLSVLGAVVGLAAGAGAAAFVWVEHALTHVLWHELPAALGLGEAPWWLVLGLPVLGGLLTWAAVRLPGHGGHSPLDGLALDILPAQLASVLLAALAGLAFGAVLGPEAPLVALGTAVGAGLVRRPGDPARQVMMVVGAMAAIGAVMGSPLVTMVLLLELGLTAGTQVTRPAVLLPSLAGLGSGYLLQVGVAQWSGLGEVGLRLPGLSAYPDVTLVDLATAVPLAIVVGGLALVARLAAVRIDRTARRFPIPSLLAAGAAVGLAALAATALTGAAPDLVLFAGQASMTSYLALGSAGAAVVILLAKLVAYIACLGGGFRGGPLFPAISIGALVAGAAALLVPGSAVAALAAVAIAAATGAAMRQPFTAVLLGALLTGSAGSATAVLAIVGAVVGTLLRIAADSRLPALAAPSGGRH